MKHIVFFAAALALSVAAHAQAPKSEPVKAEPIKAGPAQPETAKPKAAAKPAAAMAKKNSRRSEDARQCLERATNDEIIKCAEEYL